MHTASPWTSAKKAAAGDRLSHAHQPLNRDPLIALSAHCEPISRHASYNLAPLGPPQPTSGSLADPPCHPIRAFQATLSGEEERSERNGKPDLQQGERQYVYMPALVLGLTLDPVEVEPRIWWSMSVLS